MKFKTYGAAVDSLYIDIRKAKEAAFIDYYGTPDYFKQLALYIHRAYQSWCVNNDIGRGYMYDLRQVLRVHVKYYNPRSIHFAPLFDALPDEFNVRGKWTPEI